MEKWETTERSGENSGRSQLRLIETLFRDPSDVTLPKFSKYSWLSLSRIRLTRISGWVEFLSKSRTSLCINIYNLTPVESNSDESKFRLSRIKVLVPRCRKPYYLHSFSQIYLSKHVYYLGIKIGSQVKHPSLNLTFLP